MDLTEIRQRVMRESRSQPDPPTVEDVDAVINLVQRTFIQPLARQEATAPYTTTGATEVDLTSVAPALYELRELLWRDESGGYTPIPLLEEGDTFSWGIRKAGQTLFLQRMASGLDLSLRYYKRLPDLGSSQREPVIDPMWHDLYWLGASAYLNPVNQMLQMMWQTRLDEYRGERLRNGRADRRKVRAVIPWY